MAALRLTRAPRSSEAHLDDGASLPSDYIPTLQVCCMAEEYNHTIFRSNQAQLRLGQAPKHTHKKKSAWGSRVRCPGWPEWLSGLCRPHHRPASSRRLYYPRSKSRCDVPPLLQPAVTTKLMGVEAPPSRCGYPLGPRKLIYLR